MPDPRDMRPFYHSNYLPYFMSFFSKNDYSISELVSIESKKLERAFFLDKNTLFCFWFDKPRLQIADHNPKLTAKYDTY